MKAFLLAAGYGTRLKPLTDRTPKCLVSVAGKPLLEWWFVLLQKHKVESFLINTHHLADQVRDFVETTAPIYGLASTIVHEPDLIGSAGTIRANFGYIENDENFLVLYADNLTTANLSELIASHKRRSAILTMGLHRMEKPETRGIAELDEDGKIVSFIEKPKLPKSNLANGGVYMMNRAIRPRLESAFDIGFDVLPQLVGKMYGVEIEGYHRDIGTLESLEAANREWPLVNS